MMQQVCPAPREQQQLPCQCTVLPEAKSGSCTGWGSGASLSEHGAELHCISLLLHIIPLRTPPGKYGTHWLPANGRSSLPTHTTKPKVQSKAARSAITYLKKRPSCKHHIMQSLGCNLLQQGT